MLDLDERKKAVINPAVEGQYIISHTQAHVPESDGAGAVTGHELAEIDLTTIGCELLEKLDLRVLEEMLIGTEGAIVSEKGPERES